MTIPFKPRNPIDIPLNEDAWNTLSDDMNQKIHSFTLPEDSLSVGVSKEAREIECDKIIS